MVWGVGCEVKGVEGAGFCGSDLLRRELCRGNNDVARACAVLHGEDMRQDLWGVGFKV